MGAATAAILVAIFVIAIAGYFVVRARQPAPPPNASDSGPDGMGDSDGAVARDPAGMPLERPEER